MAKLLALIDGSVYSRSVCEHAVWVANRTGFSVDLLHVLGRRDAPEDQSNLSGNISLGAKSSLLNELIEHDAERARLMQQKGWAMLEDARQILNEKGVDSVSTRLRFGDLVETVAADEADADMVLIGKRGEDADFASQHLGSNLERIVRSCHKPVVVAARAFTPIQRVLVAYDGGPSCRKAIRYIATSALFDGLAFRLLFVGAESDAARKSLDDAVGELQSAGRDAQGEARPGQPEKVIAEAVEHDDIQMLIMGAYGHSRIRTLIIGSTTTTMMRLCKVPVVLFR
jgi:nucleotide-binding universal stress UspA family protein